MWCCSDKKEDQQQIDPNQMKLKRDHLDKILNQMQEEEKQADLGILDSTKCIYEIISFSDQ